MYITFQSNLAYMYILIYPHFAQMCTEIFYLFYPI